MTIHIAKVWSEIYLHSSLRVLIQHNPLYMIESKQTLKYLADTVQAAKELLVHELGLRLAPMLCNYHTTFCFCFISLTYRLFYAICCPIELFTFTVYHFYYLQMHILVHNGSKYSKISLVLHGFPVSPNIQYCVLFFNYKKAKNHRKLRISENFQCT